VVVPGAHCGEEVVAVTEVPLRNQVKLGSVFGSKVVLNKSGKLPGSNVVGCPRS
jgi:hypothetical protein